MDILIGAPVIDMSAKELQGKYLIMDMGSNGAVEFKKRYRNSIYVYIIPPTKERLIAQMVGRSKERLVRSKRQIPQVKKVCDWLVVNDNPDVAAGEIEQIMHLIREHGTNWDNVDIDTMRFLYSRNLHNPKNIEFLDNFYGKEKSLHQERE